VKLWTRDGQLFPNLITEGFPTIHEPTSSVITRAFSGIEAQVCFLPDPKKNHAHMPVLVVALP